LLCSVIDSGVISEPKIGGLLPLGIHRMGNEKQTEEQLLTELAELQSKCKLAELVSKQAEEKLRESEFQYHTLFESVPVGIGLANYDGQILSCNATMCQITGYSEEEFKKINLKDTYKNPEDRALLLERIKKEGHVRNFEVELKRKDGTLYWASLTITPFQFSGQEVLLTVAEDITECKRTEMKLTESESTLREQKFALEQKNITLREMIAQIEMEKKRIQDDIESNVNTIIFPVLEKLKIGKTPLKYVNLLQYHLGRLTTSYSSKIKKNPELTPREIEICNMVKGGLPSKDIAGLLNISSETVDKHRKNIRYKLGISNKNINLISFLREL